MKKGSLRGRIQTDKKKKVRTEKPEKDTEGKREKAPLFAGYPTDIRIDCLDGYREAWITVNSGTILESAGDITISAGGEILIEAGAVGAKPCHLISWQDH